jgi:hypothetical protein
MAHKVKSSVSAAAVDTGMGKMRGRCWLTNRFSVLGYVETAVCRVLFVGAGAR